MEDLDDGDGDGSDPPRQGRRRRPLPALPAFVLSHDHNRRRLVQRATSGTDSFHMIGDSVSDEEQGGDHGIGPVEETHVRNKKSTKSGGKGRKEGNGNGKGGNGKGGNPRPPSRPRPTGGYPRPPGMPRPSPDRPTGPPPAPSSPSGGDMPVVERPTSRPPLSPPSSSGGVVPPPPSSSYCQVPISISFLQFSAIPPALVVYPSDPDPQDLGTRYVYNNHLRDPDTLDELVGSRCTGLCTRTQARAVNGADEVLQLGGGQCSFTYTMFDGDDEFTFEASGTVVDSLGGTLAITGGTKDAIGAFGEVELLPVRLNADDGSFDVEPGDVFLEPIFYMADALLFVPCG
jgi:hypothetical protein